MRQRHAIVVGAGITGAVAAFKLKGLGWRVTVYEAQSRVGGQLRTETINGMLYEPHGPHIFHTNSVEAYQLVQPFLNDYQHHVLTTLPDGERHVTWPLQVGELELLSEWPRIKDELNGCLAKPTATNFEDYAVQLMGPTLYEWFCEGYTRKQWGVEPRQLSARFAPKRLDLRTDGDRRMFRDKYQGYAYSGWETIVESLLTGAEAEVVLGAELTARTLPHADGYVVTAPLDQFIGAGAALPWRGVHTEVRYYPGSATRLPAPVVNDPRPEVPYTRLVETRQMTYPHVNQAPMGTTVVAEFPTVGVRHYPIDDADGENRWYWRHLASKLAKLIPTAIIAGRLANYVYIDMDQAIMQGLNAARSLDNLLQVIRPE